MYSKLRDFIFIVYIVFIFMTNHLDKLSDAELLRRYKVDADMDAVGLLYKRYSVLVYGLSYKYLRHEESAKDAVNDIFLLILEKSVNYDVTFFKTWLYTLSKNYLMRVNQKEKSAVFTDFENKLEKFMENEEDETLYIQDVKEASLREAISNLNDEQRICIEQFYLNKKSYSEVAEITGLDLNKVKSNIQNGKRNLKLYLDKTKR